MGHGTGSKQAAKVGMDAVRLGVLLALISTVRVRDRHRESGVSSS